MNPKTLPLLLGALSATLRLSAAAAPPAEQTIRVSPTASVRLATGPAIHKIAISRDGTTVAYITLGGPVLARKLDSEDAQPVQGSEGATSVFFSPDGQTLALGSATNLRKTPLSGPAEVIAGTTSMMMNAGGVKWAGPDTLVYGGGRGGGIFRIKSAGGTAEPLTTLGDNETAHRQPEVIPNTDAILFTVWHTTPSEGELAVVSGPANQKKLLGIKGSSPRFIPQTGHLVFARDNALWAVRFDPAQLQPIGAAVQVLPSVQINPANGVAQYAIADNGTLAYLRVDDSPPQRLVWLDRTGKKISEAGITAPKLAFPELSPGDQSTVAFQEGASLTGPYSVVTHRFADGKRTVFPSLSANDYGPLWAPDGNQLAHISFPQVEMGGRATFTIRQVTTAAPSWPGIPAGVLYLSDWSKDGRYLLFDSGTRIGYFERAANGTGWNPEPKTLFEQMPRPFGPFFSPNGRYVTYMGVPDQAEPRAIMVRDFPGGTKEWKISTGPIANGQRFSRDGKELYFVQNQTLMVSSVDTESPEFTFTPPKPLFPIDPRYVTTGLANHPPYDVTRDNQRFLMIESEVQSRPEEIRILRNWSATLSR